MKNILINFFHQSSIHWSTYKRNDNILKLFSKYCPKLWIPIRLMISNQIMKYWGNVIIESKYKILTKNLNVEILPKHLNIYIVSQFWIYRSIDLEKSTWFWILSKMKSIDTISINSPVLKTILKFLSCIDQWSCCINF